MKIREKIIDFNFFKVYNTNEIYHINDDDFNIILDDGTELFENSKGKSDDEFNDLLNFDGDENSFYNSINLNSLLEFRKTLFQINREIDDVNFFTISSKENFSELLLNNDENKKVWNDMVLYYPLNDHSRSFLRKGDVLFCNRIGQFDNLSEALNSRGIYGVGVALTDPIEFFPNESGHNKYGVVVSFPISLISSLSTRNIQMNPITIDLTPYNGNRNDSLQYIPEKEKALELLKMISFQNKDIQNLFKIFYNYQIPQINILPSDYLNLKYKNQNSNVKIQAKNIIYYGSPGTGKSYKVDNEIKNLSPNFYERITFHPEFDHTSFIGGYKPVSAKDINGNDIIKYQFVSQAFTNIYYRAWNDQDNQYYLVIEEINRGNCAEIFGDIFQLLDRNSNYTVSPSDELKTYLIEKFGDENHDGVVKGLRLPPNLSILATMNTSDQSLFPMDSAFKRRWDWEYIPICYKEKTEEEEERENESFFYKVYLDETKTKYFKWIDFIAKINFVIEDNENLGMDKCIGNYFIKSDTKEISLKEFVNKAIFYLWNDVFKDEDSSKSIFEKGVTFEKFFPIKSNGKDLLEKILIKNNIEILPKDI